MLKLNITHSQCVTYVYIVYKTPEHLECITELRTTLIKPNAGSQPTIRPQSIICATKVTPEISLAHGFIERHFSNLLI